MVQYLSGSEFYAIQDLLHETKMNKSLCLWDEGGGEYFSFSDFNGNRVDFRKTLQMLMKLKREMLPFVSDPYPLKGILYRYGIPYKN